LTDDRSKQCLLSPHSSQELIEEGLLSSESFVARNDLKDSEDQNSLGQNSENQNHLHLQNSGTEFLGLVSVQDDNIKPLKHSNTIETLRCKEFTMETFGKILDQPRNHSSSKIIKNNYVWVNTQPALKYNSDSLISVNTKSNVNFAMLLYSIFLNADKISECHELSYRELQILNAILYKKFYKCLNFCDLNSQFQNVLSKVRSIVLYSISKRPEECYKFLLSKAIRYLKSEFRAQFKVKRVQIDKFYNFYFGEIAKKEKIQIQKFYFPSKSRKHNARSSLNSEYFSLIFKSQRFVNDLKEYISNKLFADDQNDVQKKIEQFLAKSEKALGSVDLSCMNDVNYLAGKLFVSKVLKLPWTVFEVKEAVVRVGELMKSYGQYSMN